MLMLIWSGFSFQEFVVYTQMVEVMSKIRETKIYIIALMFGYKSMRNLNNKKRFIFN